MSDDDEFRTAAIENRSNGGVRRIGGLGVPYNKRSRLLPGGFYESIENSAANKAEAGTVSRTSYLD